MIAFPARRFARNRCGTSSTGSMGWPSRRSYVGRDCVSLNVSLVDYYFTVMFPCPITTEAIKRIHSSIQTGGCL